MATASSGAVALRAFAEEGVTGISAYGTPTGGTGKLWSLWPRGVG